MYKHKDKEQYQDKDTSITKDSRKIECCSNGKCTCLYLPGGKRSPKGKEKGSNPPSCSSHQTAAATKWRWKYSTRPMHSTAGQRLR
jgi:hypothetical protein